MGYTKLFPSIVYSTIWREPDHVRIVWITMLALADQHGEVAASVPGLADAARVTVDACRNALSVLASPDPDSRSRENEGRRILEVDGGWEIVNHARYREKGSGDERASKNAERQRRWRERRRVGLLASQALHVTPGDGIKPEVRASETLGAEVSKLSPSHDQTFETSGESGAVPERETPTKAEKVTGRNASVTPPCQADAEADHDQIPEVSKPSHPSSKAPLVSLVFETWRTVMGHPRAKLDRTRRARIEARLRDGYTVDQLVAAIEGASRSAWHMGDNPEGRRYDGIQTVLRDAEQVEKFIDLSGLVRPEVGPGQQRPPVLTAAQQEHQRKRLAAEAAEQADVVARKLPIGSLFG